MLICAGWLPQDEVFGWRGAAGLAMSGVTCYFPVVHSCIAGLLHAAGPCGPGRERHTSIHLFMAVPAGPGRRGTSTS
jgi:hypothetical protein